MSTSFRNQTIAGHQVGASRHMEYGLLFITASLVAINCYHLSNFLISKLTTPETSVLFIGLLCLVGIGIACLEVPVGKGLIVSYRLTGFSMSTLIQSLLALAILSMAVTAGINSQTADADKRDTQSASYNLTESSFSNLRQSARFERDSLLARAELIQDTPSRAIAKLEAEKHFQDALISITQAQAANRLKKPVETFETGSTGQRFTIALFSLVCSLGAMFTSAFSAVFVNPLVALPAFSLRAKVNHDWQSDGSDFKTMTHEFTPMGNPLSRFLLREKVQAKPLPSTDESAATTSAPINTAQTPPNRLDSSSEALPLVSERSLNTGIHDTDRVDYSSAHYDAIKAAIMSKALKPTQAPVKKKLIALKVRFVDDAARQQKAVAILEQLNHEGVLRINPEYGTSGKVVAQYVLNADDQSAVEQGIDIRARCPACHKLELIQAGQLEQSKGRVKSLCGHVYIVQDHLA